MCRKNLKNFEFIWEFAYFFKKFRENLNLFDFLKFDFNF